MASAEQTIGPTLAADSAAVACAHCGLDVPAGMLVPGHAQQFCCGGCRAVHGVLCDLGLDRYYDVAADLAQEQVAAAPAAPTDRSYAELDDPAFAALHCQTVGGALAVELYLEGVHCGACVWLLERLPSVQSGVLEARLDLGRSVLRLRWDPRRLRLSEVARLLDSMGYPVHPSRGLDRQQVRRAEDRRLLVKLAVCGAVAANVMLLAVALYSGWFHAMAASHQALFRWASLLLSLPAVVLGGGVFFRGAWSALRARVLNMDLPISLGLGAGIAWSVANTLRGAGEVYFDSVTALIFLLLVGRYLQRRQQRGALDATEQIFALTPSVVRVLQQDDVREVPLEAVLPGVVVEVLAGQTIPVDGAVCAGRSRVDTALLTGESTPATVGPGDRVFAGTTNLGARLRLEVRATGEQTRVGKLMQLVEQFSRRKAPVVRLADRIAGVFVASVLALAAVTLALWLWLDPSRALEHTMALLIVTCPCALGLATPLAIAVAVGRAASAGMLVKGGDALEHLARPGLLLLDKTGTLTEGAARVVRWHGPAELKPLAAALEQHSAHHVARALVQAVEDPAELTAEQVSEQPGGGIEGVVSGQRVVLGNRRFVEARAAVGQRAAAWEDQLARQGLTPVLVAVDGAVKAAAGVGDPLRADAAHTVAQLRQRGWRIKLLSGDHRGAVLAAGRSLGLDPADCTAGATPEQKLAVVERSLRQAGPVVMVGDGVNDAAALSAATVGVAVHGGAEASLAAADVYITRPGLGALSRLQQLSRGTVRVIRRNFIFSLTYNLVGASLAISGLISPLVAAVLMPLSSLTVVASSLRAGRSARRAPGDPCQ